MSSVLVTIAVTTNNASHEFFASKMKHIMEAGKPVKVTGYDDHGVRWESVDGIIMRVEK